MAQKIPNKQVKYMRKQCPSLYVHYRFLSYDPVLCVSEEVRHCKNLNLLMTLQLPAIDPNVCELSKLKVEEHSFKPVCFYLIYL